MCIYDSSSPVLFLVLKMHFGFQTVSAACPYNIFKNAMTVYCDLTDVPYNMMKTSPHKQQRLL